MKKSLLSLLSLLISVSSCSISTNQPSTIVISSQSSVIIEENSNFDSKLVKDYVSKNYYNKDTFSYYRDTYEKRIARKTLPDFLMSVPNFVLVPPNEELGFELAYAIKFPSGRYFEENKDNKKYLLLGNFDPNPSNEEFGFALDVYIDQNVYDEGPNYITPPAITADRLNVPLLTPIVPWNCPGTEYDQAVNVHLDRDSVLASLENISSYKKTWCGPNEVRLDKPFEPYEYASFIDLEKQIYNIILHAIDLLNKFDYGIESKVMFTGFSNVGLFAQRFSTVYPEIVKAYYAGAIVFPIVPGKKFDGFDLIYPIGVSENEEIFGREFNLEEYNKIAKLSIVGKYEFKISYYDKYVRQTMIDLYIKENDFDWGDPKRPDGIDKYWTRVVDIFYALGGQGMFVLNTLTAHALSESDIEFSIEFLRMNSKFDNPVYPDNSKFSEHVLRLGWVCQKFNIRLHI